MAVRRIGRNTRLDQLAKQAARREAEHLVRDRFTAVRQILKTAVRPTWTAYRKFLRLELAMVEQVMRLGKDTRA